MTNEQKHVHKPGDGTSIYFEDQIVPGIIKSCRSCKWNTFFDGPYYQRGDCNDVRKQVKLLPQESPCGNRSRHEFLIVYAKCRDCADFNENQVYQQVLKNPIAEKYYGCYYYAYRNCTKPDFKGFVDRKTYYANLVRKEKGIEHRDPGHGYEEITRSISDWPEIHRFGMRYPDRVFVDEVDYKVARKQIRDLKVEISTKDASISRLEARVKDLEGEGVSKCVRCNHAFTKDEMNAAFCPICGLDMKVMKRMILNGKIENETPFEFKARYTLPEIPELGIWQLVLSAGFFALFVFLLMVREILEFTPGVILGMVTSLIIAAAGLEGAFNFTLRLKRRMIRREINRSLKRYGKDVDDVLACKIRAFIDGLVDKLEKEIQAHKEDEVMKGFLDLELTRLKTKTLKAVGILENLEKGHEE
jgi:hypothetical protein